MGLENGVFSGHDSIGTKYSLMLLLIKFLNQSLIEKKLKSGTIDMNWKPLTSESQLEEIDKLSEKQPVLIFKHSTRCSISAASLNRFERKWDDGKSQNLQAYFLDLIANREVSNIIAEKYGIAHQSPQVLLIQNGICVYDTSHFGISFEEVVNNIKPIAA